MRKLNLTVWRRGLRVLSSIQRLVWLNQIQPDADCLCRCEHSTRTRAWTKIPAPRPYLSEVVLVQFQLLSGLITANESIQLDEGNQTWHVL